MARYYRELLAASRVLLKREDGRRGPLPAARIRRSISTSYYALFHFLQEECATRAIGGGGRHRLRRRIFIRALTHRGMTIALRKVAGAAPAPDVADFLGGVTRCAASTPGFARTLASAFIEAQGERHAADYDLNAKPIELDARALILSVEEAIGAWVGATSARDEDFKDALCLLMLLRGRLRADDA